jgi:hypothetical protein
VHKEADTRKNRTKIRYIIPRVDIASDVQRGKQSVMDIENIMHNKCTQYARAGCEKQTAVHSLCE